VTTLSAVGCGGSDSGERQRVEQFANAARADLLAGRAGAACSRLTPRGRQRALQFAVDFEKRPPRTCEQVVRRERAAAARPNVDVTWPSQLRAAKIRVAETTGNRARIELTPPRGGSPIATVTAVKTPAGWRLDDASVVPAGQ
jgi:hypothetical protein